MDSDSSSVISFDSSSEMSFNGQQLESRSMNPMSSCVESSESKIARLEAENSLLKATISKQNDVMSFLHSDEQSLNDEISRFQNKFKDLKQEMIEKKKLEYDSSSYIEMENCISDVKHMYEVWKEVSESMRETVLKAIQKIEPFTLVKSTDVSDKIEFVKEGNVAVIGDVNAETAKHTSNTETASENDNYEANAARSLIPLEPSTEKLCDNLCGKWRNETGWGVHGMTIEKMENGHYRTTVFNKHGSEIVPSLWRADGIVRDYSLYFQLGNTICNRKHEPEQYNVCEQYKYKFPNMLIKTVTYHDGSENVFKYSRI